MYSDKATVNYYPDTVSYDTFKGKLRREHLLQFLVLGWRKSIVLLFSLNITGYDLIPENRHNYPAGNPLGDLNYKDRDKILKSPINIQECRVPKEDGGAWHVQRVVSFHYQY